VGGDLAEAFHGPAAAGVEGTDQAEQTKWFIRHENPSSGCHIGIPSRESELSFMHNQQSLIQTLEALSAWPVEVGAQDTTTSHTFHGNF
jgi:hypothetical protein